MPQSAPKQALSPHPPTEAVGPNASLSTLSTQPGAQFATTHWSRVVAAADAKTSAGHAALEQLCRAYWKPLFVVARRLGQGEHDAQDLTQAFFEQFLE